MNEYKFTIQCGSMEDVFSVLSKVSLSFNDFVSDAKLNRNKLASEILNESSDLLLPNVPITLGDILENYSKERAMYAVYEFLKSYNENCDINIVNDHDSIILTYTTWSGKNKYILKRYPDYADYGPRIEVTWICQSKNGTCLEAIKKYNTGIAVAYGWGY